MKLYDGGVKIIITIVLIALMSSSYITNFEFNKEKNQIIITYEAPVYWMEYTNYDVWKEVYGVIDGKIQMIEKIYGTYIMPKEGYVIFPEEKDKK